MLLQGRHWGWQEVSLNYQHHRSRMFSWNRRLAKPKVDEGGAAGANVKDTKKFCFRCYKPGHRKLECIAKLLCEICSNTEHLTSKCPILKQPRTLAHPRGYDVSGLGFYHMLHIPLQNQRTARLWLQLKGVH
jgi:hypothetical protein